MTDTAVPMSNAKLRTTDPGALTAAQRQRAAALDVARQALSNRQVFAGNNVNGWSVSDLTYVAEWVLGVDDDQSEATNTPAESDAEPVELGSHSALDGGFPSALDAATPYDAEDDTDVLLSYPEEALPR